MTSLTSAPAEPSQYDVPQAPAKRFLSRYGLPVLLLALCVYYLPGKMGYLGVFHDDGLYVMQGRSLAEGKGYRIESIPGAPPQTKYPILYPALLALLWKLSPQYPENLRLFQAANIALWLGALALMYRLLTRFRYATHTQALAIVALWGLSNGAVLVNSILLSEACFTLLFVGSLWYAEMFLQAEERRRSLRYAALCGLLAGLAFLTRTSGLFLLSALALVFWRKSRASRLSLFGAAAPFVIGWLAWTRVKPPTPPWDLRGYYVNYLGWGLNQLSTISLPLLIAGNLITITAWILPSQAVHALTLNIINNHAKGPMALGFILFGLCVCALYFWGAWTLWRSGRPLLPAVMLMTLLPLLIYPFDAERFLVPVGGVNILMLFLGWQELAERLGAGRKALIGVTAIVLAFSLLRDGHNLKYRAQQFPGDVWDPGVDWVRAHVPQDEGILASIDPRIYLTTGHRGISDRLWLAPEWNGPFIRWAGRKGYCPDPEKQREQLRRMGIRWALDVGDLSDYKQFGASSLLVARPEWFERVYSLGHGKIHIYRLKD